ncbi:MAG: Glycosyltransferase, group 2 family protein [Candidatus Shapirobacteria bacterium GW2011_GWE1_38_10]|uniref:Glycosyltransferase, group 2 family protein n=1 Tax=Candidatus Shapirobacteria bacterium GW2011_GWE1_38_10 TaxID=1618488 RepID=A0A0G0IGA0_9BACT|nr:MAG: Glycosyltransferase, group 2 family protein [Candidatus Shapirobacteria bacterium GW2011_GWF2_37_20]KKQ50050.1 MAG: Glycosyltransferase, group 2 family protein [Candidatus Shapirobacteria bacterium GW2011_GWE1_38_10]KKQ64558.1 MAG: Glycosyltransferase, group 2 family protein [Candidatus Shapirobacteria bacterium GW2011_GWF1_38_23]
MKLVVQIPCYNEEKSLEKVLGQIPKKIKGISNIEVQIIDDGSIDNTVKIAQKFRVDRIIKHKMNQGLGVSFSDGVEAALRAGADILVNTDGDDQYPGKYINDLVAPIIEGKADIVIANRQTKKVKFFSKNKKNLQSIGSFAVRYLSGTDVPDAVSGFRAYSRESLLELNTITKFSYCIDTIVQAGKKGLKIVSIPIIINSPTRESRLFKNIWQHIRKSSVNLLRVFAVYEPFKTFLIIAVILVIPALFFMLRFIYFYLFIPTDAAGHIQSLIFGSAFLISSIQMLALGILADLISINRRLMEKILKYQKENVK